MIRRFAPFVSTVLLAIYAPCTPALYAADSKDQTIWLSEPRLLRVRHAAEAATVLIVAPAELRPLALASGEADQDGIADLVAGDERPGGGIIVRHRGILDALAPQSRGSFEAIG